jgi:hypothetical protein
LGIISFFGVYLKKCVEGCWGMGVWGKKYGLVNGLLGSFMGR